MKEAFYVQSVPRLYNEDQFPLRERQTSTVTLRIVGGDEKESFKSETVKYGRKSQGTTTEKDCAGKGQRHIQKTDRPLVREGVPRNEERNCQTYSIFRTEKNLVVSPGWVLYTKTDWPTDRRS
jgi:hypothetical protein